jgi:hypothetical protein
MRERFLTSKKCPKNVGRSDSNAVDGLIQLSAYLDRRQRCRMNNKAVNPFFNSGTQDDLQLLLEILHLMLPGSEMKLSDQGVLRYSLSALG